MSFVDSKGFPCPRLNQGCQQRGPPVPERPGLAFSGVCHQGTALPWSVGAFRTGAPGLVSGVCPLNGGKQPQEEGGPTHHQNHSQTTGFPWIARPQTSTPSEVIIISWRTSPILYTFQANLLRAGYFPGGSWRGRNPLLELEL